MKIYIGADHRGFEMKEKIRIWLKKLGYNIEDCGAFELNEKDDYTLYAEKVASLVADNSRSFGILLCGSGVGVEIAANKFDGVRASIGKLPEQIKDGRSDDAMNVLVIAADYTPLIESKRMVKMFLHTAYEKNARHDRRLSDIEKIEANN